MLRIYLTNLGKYNEGMLVGEWVDLPVSEEELEKVFNRIGINDEYEEYFITDYESDIDGVKVGEYENIDDLNELAEALEDLDSEEENVLSVMLEDGCTFEEALEKIKDRDYMVYYNCNSMEDVAYQVIEESGLLDGVPEKVARYFNYEAYGRDLEIEGTFYLINNAYIEIFK